VVIYLWRTYGSIHTHYFSALYNQYLADMLIVQSIACSDLLGHYDVLKNLANGPQVGKQHGHNRSVFVTGSIHQYVMLYVFSLPYSNYLEQSGSHGFIIFCRVINTHRYWSVNSLARKAYNLITKQLEGEWSRWCFVLFNLWSSLTTLSIIN